MNLLPRVLEVTRERVTEEFDNLGPETCLERISAEMTRHNPELFDMARRCARDVTPAGADPAKIMVGFAMLYRLLLAQWEADQGQAEQNRAPRPRDAAGKTKPSRARHSNPDGHHGCPSLNPLPCVTPAVRDALVQRIDDQTAEVFTVAALEDIDFHNPQLLHMAHNFAMGFPDYLGIMQGFALLYMALTLQADADRKRMQ